MTVRFAKVHFNDGEPPVRVKILDTSRAALLGHEVNRYGAVQGGPLVIDRARVKKISPLTWDKDYAILVPQTQKEA